MSDAKESPPQVDDPPITITLPLSEWHTVTDHLRKGICGDTFDVLLLIYFQSDRQLLEAARIQRIALEQAGLLEVVGAASEGKEGDRGVNLAKVH